MDCPICEEDLGQGATPADLISHTEQEHLLSDAQTQFGGRCEDYPCCGHQNEDGSSDCPIYSGGSGYLPYPCLGCGKRIKVGSPDDASSSYCRTCLGSGRATCEGPDCPGCGYCLDDRCDEDEDEPEDEPESCADCHECDDCSGTCCNTCSKTCACCKAAAKFERDSYGDD